MSPLQAAIFLYRFGLDDGTRHSLEETGMKFGMSRERVRAQEAMSIEEMRSLAKERGESGIERTQREHRERRNRNRSGKPSGPPVFR